VSVKVTSLSLELYKGMMPVLRAGMESSSGFTFYKKANTTASKRAVELLRDLITQIEKDSLELLQEDFKKGGEG
jgi:hypothetical protein